MSVASEHRSATLSTRLKSGAPDLVFVLLASINAFRLFRHAMWGDELQDFLLAEASSSPLDLFLKLKYEGHAGLWHLLLWVITRFTSDPLWMQVLHLLIALGIWVLIWRAAPFGKIQKLLLLLSYFLFFEYFVISRCYAIGVLLGFGFIALRTERPEQRFWPWILLGLLANTSVFGAIWALGMGLFFAMQNRREWRSMLAGAALCALLVGLAAVTMIPAADNQFAAYAPSFKSASLDQPLHFAIGAFFPLFWPFTPLALKWIGGGWGASLAAAPFGRDPAQQLFLLLGGGAANQLPVLVVLTAPILACWSIVRERLLTLQFAVIYTGILLFAQLSQYAFSPRHFGFVFVALVGVVWMGWRAMPPRWPATLVWVSLLAINALGGLTTLSAVAWPFSQSRNVATWLERRGLDDAFVMAAPDYAASAIVGYLQRPLYYLNCECFGTYVEWRGSHRKHGLNVTDIVVRATRAMSRENKSEAYLVVNVSEPIDRQTLEPNLTFEPIKRFRPAIIGSESYVIYRVTRREK